MSDDQLTAASKFNEVLSTLDFARNLKKQLSSLLTTKKQKKHNVDGEKLPTKIDSKIKEVLIFQVNWWYYYLFLNKQLKVTYQWWKGQLM